MDGILNQKDTAIEQLIELYGNPYRAAKHLGLDNDMIVRHWVKKGFIPYRRGTFIEEKTGGKITALKVWIDAAKASSN